ncbi:MAG TPA: isoleucine--tRNA ligase [Actinomycetota bacterium]|nr:isoleucine--tRNA ligase [Actinomycetota bacterium]
MFEQVPNKPGLVEGEHKVLEYWDESQAFHKLRSKNAGKPRWSFLDGPITANGYMGVHHAWGRTYKDAFQRFFAMTGHDQRFQNGFDCQGLWVEVQVERELGFKSKRDIERYGIEEFIQRCKERVWKYSAIQTRQSIRLGMWMDWDNSYYTMSDENNYTIWSFLSRCHERGLIYKGLDAMPWCPRCGTGISEQERKEGYREIDDEAVYVRFPLQDAENEYLLVWTTTPWTLAANVAAAVNPDVTYLKVKQGDHIYYLSKGRLQILSSETRRLGEPEVMAELNGADMVGWRFRGPFDDLPAAAPAAQEHRVIAWDEVSEASGTGIVHIAPGCGKEDFDLGKKFGFPIISPIDDSGIYVEGFGPLTGTPASEVAPKVYDSLESKGLLFKRERYRHDYPHCWRCGTALLFRAVDEWYIDMTWREEIKQIVRQIRWIPDYGEDLELDWLTNMGDWMISKKRYWGLALPIFECPDCGWFDVIGGREELKARAVSGWEEFEGDPENPNTPHRPWVDAVKIACGGGCGGVASRIPDVGNPWLDAGIVPYSTVGYNTDRQYWARWVPADFVTESFPGQFRNWFYALLTMSTMMENIPPFKTLLGYASVRDEEGREMHYSLGNSIEFDEAADRMSADVMRWMYCRHTPTINLNFGYALGEHLERKVFGTLWNSYLFFCNYAILDRFDPAAEQVPIEERPEIDRWILSNLQMLIQSGQDQFRDYWIAPFVRKAEDFIEELSNWYIRRNRQRFWDPRGKNEKDKMAAYQTLYQVLVTLSKLLAPVIPFLTERMYGNLVRSVESLGPQPDSVHLCDYPEADSTLVDEELSFQMRVAQQVASSARALREEAGQRVRQPLAQLLVATRSDDERAALERLKDLILDEINVKTLSAVDSLKDLTEVSIRPNFASLGPKFGRQVQAVAGAVRNAAHESVSMLQEGSTVEMGDGEGRWEITPDDVFIDVSTRPGWAVGQAGDLQIALDTRLSDELRQEGLARDVVRHLQQLRKERDLNIQDHIEAAYRTTNEELRTAVAEWHDYISGETQADRLIEGSLGVEGKQVKLGSAELTLELKPIPAQVPAGHR